MALTHRLEQQFDCSIKPAILLQAPTVTKLAAWLRENHPDVQIQTANGTTHGHYEGDI